MILTSPLSISEMEIDAAAGRWAETWGHAWPVKDVEAIVALYADTALYRSQPFGEARQGRDGVRAYLEENFGVEEEVECWFSKPTVSGERAAVEWWGTWVEDGERMTLAGATVLRFDEDGLVIDHRDYWNQVDERRPPYPAW
jgi:ketosteroid isomerase-like protein